MGGRRSIGRSIDTSSDRSISIYGRINRSMRRNICRSTGRGAGMNNYRSIGRSVDRKFCIRIRSNTDTSMARNICGSIGTSIDENICRGFDGSKL